MDMPVEKKIVFELNGRSVEAIEGETILEAADRIGVEIPRLCYKEGIRADGNCRACVVEIDGERALAPSCCRYPTEGMKVTSNEGKARHSQEMVLSFYWPTCRIRKILLTAWIPNSIFGRTNLEFRPPDFHKGINPLRMKAIQRFRSISMPVFNVHVV